MKKFKGKGYKNGTKAPPGSQHFKKPKKQLVDCTDEKLMLQLLSELLLPNGKIHKGPAMTVRYDLYLESFSSSKSRPWLPGTVRINKLVRIFMVAYASTIVKATSGVYLEKI